MEKLDDGAGFLPSEYNFDNFVALVVGTLITHIINFCSSILNFKFECIVDVINIVLIELGVEELLEDDWLVASQGEILAADEGREESKMFGRHVTFSWTGLFKERFYLTFYYLLVDHIFYWFCIVFEDCKKTLLNERFIDVIGVFNEILEPSWEEYFIVLEIFDNMLN